MGDFPPRKKKRLCVYLKRWEEQYSWLTCVPDNHLRARCVCCNREFSISHGGENDVKQHSSTSIHKRSMSVLLDNVSVTDYSDIPVPDMSMMSDPENIVELNVGGVYYSSSLETLRKDSGSYLAKMFSDTSRHMAVKDTKGKYFIDRDGVLFRYILDYLRNLRLVLPENFHEKERLQQEAEYYQLPNLVKILSTYHAHRPSPNLTFPSVTQIKQEPGATESLSTQSGAANSSATLSKTGQPSVTDELTLPSSNADNLNSCSAPSPIGDRGPGYITVGYRGTFAFGRDGLADVKFRKLSRIIVCGKVSLCREVFKDTLNESRDPDRGENDRYTSRFFLKHSFLEQAFDMLQEEGFALVGSCGSGTNSAGELKPGMDSEEAKWQHYNEFIFERH